MSEKSTWEHYGAENPYFAVSTFDYFRGKSLDSESFAKFVESGELYVSEIWKDIESHFEKGFKPETALDFGCGVGRLAIPMAKRSGSVTGIDISSTMLKEAVVNATRCEVSNVEFVEVDGDLGDIRQSYDFVHSFIVIQHINPKLGEKVFTQLIDRLNPDGIGALHMTYFRPGTFMNRFNTEITRRFPLLYKLRNKLKNEDVEPPIPMHCYDLNRIFKILHDNDCHRIYTRLTFHGLNGILIMFKKSKDLLE